MKSIARELGLSIATVSKVIRQHPDISAETRERVQSRLKALNYHPNLTARALVTGKTFSIGFVVPDLVHPFFGEVATGLSKVLHRDGYDLIMFSSEEDLDLERRGIQQLLARRVDAVFVASAQQDAASLQFLAQQKVPWIMIDRCPPGLNANFVGVNDEQVGVIATTHLIASGRRRIAHIGGPAVSTAAGRLRGYKAALERHSLTFDDKYVISRGRGDAVSDSTGYEAMNTLLQRTPIPDAVFCYNDPTAMGAMEAALEHGLRIPQDLAIVGVGNVRYSRFLRVPLTTVDQQSQAIGERAAELALELVKAKGKLEPQSILLRPNLVIRESSSPQI